MEEKRIYALKNPETNVIFYIGATATSLKTRLHRHINIAKKSSHISNSKHSYINYILEKGLKPAIITIHNYCEDWEEQEKFYINLYKDTIFNRTIGGENEVFKKERIPWNLGGGKYAPETIEKMRQSKIGTKQSEQHKLNSSLAARGKPKSDFHKNNIRQKLGRTILKLDLEENILQEYSAVSFAVAELIGGNYKNTENQNLGRKIRHACLKNKIVNNFKWKFKN